LSSKSASFLLSPSLLSCVCSYFSLTLIGNAESIYCLQYEISKEIFPLEARCGCCLRDSTSAGPQEAETGRGHPSRVPLSSPSLPSHPSSPFLLFPFLPPPVPSFPSLFSYCVSPISNVT